MSGSEESSRILPACTFQESISEPIKVKWHDIKYSDPNPKKWVLDSAYPADKTSQKASKCFKDQNPEKRLLDQLNESVSNGSGAEKVDQKAVLGQKQPEKKRKRLLSSDEDDFASDTFVQSKVRRESSEMRNAVFGVKNDKFSEKDLEELQNKLLSKKNNEYESKKNIWKDIKVTS